MCVSESAKISTLVCRSNSSSRLWNLLNNPQVFWWNTSYPYSLWIDRNTLVKDRDRFQYHNNSKSTCILRLDGRYQRPLPCLTLLIAEKEKVLFAWPTSSSNTVILTPSGWTKTFLCTHNILKATIKINCETNKRLANAPAILIQFWTFLPNSVVY